LLFADAMSSPRDAAFHIACYAYFSSSDFMMPIQMLDMPLRFHFRHFD